MPKRSSHALSSRLCPLLWLLWAAACSTQATQPMPEVPPVPRHAACPAPGDAHIQLTGQRVYTRLCANCHQTQGQGLPGIFPPLAGHAARLGQTPEGRAYLVQLVLWGLSGPITVGGKIYQNVMPPQAASLSDEEVAAVLAYVNYAFDNCHSFAQMPSFAPADVAAARKVPSSGLETFNKRRTTTFAQSAGKS